MLLFRTELFRNICGHHRLLSPRPWILRVKLSPDSDAIKAQETGYHELGPARILLRSTWGLASLDSLVTETGGKGKLDGLGGVWISRWDMGLLISPDNRGKLPLCAPEEYILKCTGHWIPFSNRFQYKRSFRIVLWMSETRYPEYYWIYPIFHSLHSAVYSRSCVEGQCSDRREVLGTGIPCFRRQNVGTSCCLDVLVHESTHPTDLFWTCYILFLWYSALSL